VQTVDGLAEGEKDEQAEGAEQEVDEDEILNILKFGADKIFKSSGRDINEMSLDEILRQSEERDGMQVSAEDERPPDSLFSVQPELIAKDAPTPKEQRQEEAQQTQAAEEAAAQAAPASPPPLGRVRSRAPKKVVCFCCGVAAFVWFGEEKKICWEAGVWLRPLCGF
jgi:hypothetical protein